MRTGSWGQAFLMNGRSHVAWVLGTFTNAEQAGHFACCPSLPSGTSSVLSAFGAFKLYRHLELARFFVRS